MFHIEAIPVFFHLFTPFVVERMKTALAGLTYIVYGYLKTNIQPSDNWDLGSLGLHTASIQRTF